MHIVNYSDNQGYAVISFDDRDGDIIAYSGNGNFNIQDTASNQGLKLHLEMMIAYQQSKRDRIQEFEARGEEYLGELVFVNPTTNHNRKWRGQALPECRACRDNKIIEM